MFGGDRILSLLCTGGRREGWMSVPVTLPNLADDWLYRNYVIERDGAWTLSEDERLLRVKHAVLSREQDFETLKRQV